MYVYRDIYLSIERDDERDRVRERKDPIPRQSCFGLSMYTRNLLKKAQHKTLWWCSSQDFPSQDGLLDPYIPRGSNVVPFWLWPIFFLGITIYCSKKNYIGALG